MSSRYLAVLEVSQKQSYIFSSNKLKDNITNSAVIAWIMSPEYFEEVIGDEKLFSKEKNLVYSGGGRTVLEFVSDDKEEAEKKARDFVKQITAAISRDYAGVAVFAKTMVYKDSLSPAENLKTLFEELEKKKAVRDSAFRQGSFGVERIDTNTLEPVRAGNQPGTENRMPASEEKVDKELSPENYRQVYKFEKLGGSENESNFIAVVHIDGNAMGKRVQELQESGSQKDWDAYKQMMQKFSDSVDNDFKAAYKAMAKQVAFNLEQGYLDSLSLEEKDFPVRRIITAGDDICFVTEGRIGIECAVAFLRKLNTCVNEEDKKGYAACAGVAIVHRKYPFYKAYELAELLCSNAKRFAATFDDEGLGREVSAIDWHIEMGELKDSLEEIRADYNAADGRRLELRPYLVSAPEDVMKKEKIRQYQNFRKLITDVLSEDILYARGKLKELRSVLKRKPDEIEYYLKFNKIEDIALDCYQGIYKPLEMDNVGTGKGLEGKIFIETTDGCERSLLFDAIELMDTYIKLTDEEVQP